MNKRWIWICAALLTVFVIAGCGLVSGTAFITQKVDNRIAAADGTSLQRAPGNANLDDPTFRGVLVDMTQNGDWKNVTIEGVEDMCFHAIGVNHLATAVSGEVWIVINDDTTLTQAQVQAQGFRVFAGIAFPAGQQNVPRTFTCEETRALLENSDRLVDAIKKGKFTAWGFGDQSH